MKLHPQNEKTVHQLVKTGELLIDSMGRIWKKKLRHGVGQRKGTRVTPCVPRRAERTVGMGYLQVKAMINGKAICAAAHRLVWFNLYGEIPQGKTINHKNCVKSDNRPENLELATYSENLKHSFKVLGTKHWDVRGSNHPKTNLTDKDVLQIRQLRRNGEMVIKIAKRFNMKPKAITAICNRHTWKHLP